MWRRISPVLKIFLSFLGFFIIQKPIFFLYNRNAFPNEGWSDLWDVICAGFTMDISMACYLTMIPLLMSIVAIYWPHRILLKIVKAYALLFSFVVSAIYVVDMGLFSYWQFRLDSTPVFYFLSSPKSALASGTTWEYILALLLVALYTYGMYRLLVWDAIRPKYWTYKCRKKILTTVTLLLCGGLVFLGIRGGWTVSTMNTGRAYFSSNDMLNQAAINPAFSFMESMIKGDKLGKQYQFYAPEEMNRLVDALYQRKEVAVDQAMLINTTRPDIYLIVLESFSTPLMESVIDGEEITPNLNQLAKESVYFSNFYANSFRTDRGLTAILSGYPSQPSTSILKYPRKSSQLSGIGMLLKEAGYDLNYFYGGDINFTNLNAYLKRQGFDHIISDEDFPLSEKLSKWGVHDHFVFNRALEDIKQMDTTKPQLTVVQTSSSHEPFEVPFEKFAELKPNAFAYADQCLADFIAGLKAQGKWDNSLVIIVPDHYGAYPEGLISYEERRYEIPLIWTGGAIKEPQNVSVLGSQMDIAATLLGQLGINASSMPFSTNMLDQNAAHFAYFSHPGYVGLIKPQSAGALNLVTDEVMWQRGDDGALTIDEAKALLQKIYKDIASK